ncbi:hypothetical protein TYRP_011994 [Tyrophagus putrescentiae]|nr:hypothetical protein TYRP_011994 [Tyrophagus putrescentiae]
MKFFTCLALLATLATLASANHEIRIHNNCRHPIWPGLLNNPGKQLPEAGGFELNAGATHVLHVPDAWAGRVWARTGCNGAGTCETGDCGGGKYDCNPAGCHSDLNAHCPPELAQKSGRDIPLPAFPPA